MSAPSAQRSSRTRYPLPLSRRLGLWYALGCLLAIVTLASCGLNLPGVRSTPTSSSGAQLSPAWEAVLNQIGPNGEISLSTALQAYTLAFGPLPGVQAPADAGGLMLSGTLAESMILQHYRDLTPAQQQAVLQRLGYTAPASAEVSPPSAARVAALAQDQVGSREQTLAAPAVPAAPTPTPTCVGSGPVLATPTLTPTPSCGGPGPATPTPTPSCGSVPVPADEPGTQPYRAMLDEFIPKLNAYLSYTFTLPVVLSFDPALKGKTAGARTDPIDGCGGFTGSPVLCRIHLNADVLKLLSIEDQRLTIGHELVHCYQAAIIGSIFILYHAPTWLIEGSATWAGAVLAGATSHSYWLQVFWPQWLAHPAYPLFHHAYGAIGFYALLDEAGIPPWEVLPAMFLSQTKGTVPDNLAAYQAGTKPLPQRVLDEWASSFERDPSLGPDWDLTGPGILAASAYGGPPIHAVTLSNGQPLSVVLVGYTASDYDLTSQADVVQVNITGTSRLKDSASFERVTSANGSYCTKPGGCSCPTGSAYQGPALQQLTGLVHLAVTGGPQGVKGSVSGLTLQQFCNQKAVDTSLCDIISVAEFSQAVGGNVTRLIATTTTLSSGVVIVNCGYLPPSIPGPGGAIVFAITSNGPAYYTQVMQEEQSGLNSVNVLSGVGDAAFWGTDSTAEDILNLDMVKGNVVVGITMDGSATDGSKYLPGAEQMAKEIASRL